MTDRFPKLQEILDGTDYTLVVTREHSDVKGTFWYDVRLLKPVTLVANPLHYEDDLELVDARTLSIFSNEDDLARLVRDMIDNDPPSLSGTYTSN